MEETLISPPHSPSLDASSLLPNLPADLVEEILARLPVKFLLQFRCVCKSWNSLINDNPTFAKKHLRLSTTNRRLLLNILSHSKNTRGNYILKSYPIKSTTTSNATQLDGEFHFNAAYPMIGSCDGILCLAGNFMDNFVILWNPSIRKSNKLPPLENPKPTVSSPSFTSYGFGYDSLSHNYKVVVVIYYTISGFFISPSHSGNWIFKTQVKVHSLGTNFWRKIQEFPSVPFFQQSGKFVNGKLHWLTFPLVGMDIGKSMIVSLDLGNESYQEVLQPDYGEEVDVPHVSPLMMGVLNDCLSMLTCHSVWVMKEYGNKEPWTKMFSLPNYIELNYMEPYGFTKAIYTFEDHQVDNIPEVSVESLISA